MITPITDTPMNLSDARMWARIGVLAALAVVIGWAETFIPLPLPVPGVKLGLANIVILVAVVLVGSRFAAVVALVKVLATGFLFGNPLMMLFSAAGTALAYLALVVLVRVRGLHIAVVSVVAAMAHNVGQLAVAQVVLGTPLVWYSAPFMLLAACITGALCGFAAKWTLEALDNTVVAAGGNSVSNGLSDSSLLAGETADEKLPMNGTPGCDACERNIVRGDSAAR